MERLKILIIRLSAIGDTIHTLPLAYALRKKYPDAQIDWLVEDKAAQFVVDNPLLDNVFVIPKREWKKRGFSYKNLLEFNDIASKLKQQNYDIAIDTQQLFKSSIFLKYSKAKRKIALSGGREFSRIFANEIIPSKHSLFEQNYHVVNRNLEIAQYLGCDSNEIKFVLPQIPESVRAAVDEMLEALQPLPTIVIAPATTWSTKHWNNKYWAEIIKNFQYRANIIVTATSSDKDLVDDILSRVEVKNILNLTGRTNLVELAEIFKRADVVIAPDSGSAQIAWACEKPYVISVFTATSKNRTAPFGENACSFAPDISCYPCHKKTCSSQDFELCKNNIDYYEIIKVLENIFK
ncbi:glycosyltransferase family 9 protein [bacterium]|nr:glycosyltransferase family 9 protein [bacterium]